MKASARKKTNNLGDSVLNVSKPLSLPCADLFEGAVFSERGGREMIIELEIVRARSRAALIEREPDAAARAEALSYRSISRSPRRGGR